MTPKVTKESKVEVAKRHGRHLRGAIGETLASEATHFAEDDVSLLKFHGTYQQDDRDLRRAREAAGQEKAYAFMVRVAIPAGAINAEQYLGLEEIADEHGNHTLRVTTRQGFQFHGVLKGDLKATIAGVNQKLLTTIAACGDVERNVMAPPTPATSPLVDQVLEEARKLSNALNPATRAYHKIWIEGQELNLNDPSNQNFLDPLYGKTYLPRKFKTAFAFPPLNDIDIFTNDLGFVVIAEGEKLVGYNLLAGGGMGMSHGNAQTYPRVADVIGFLRPEHLEAVTKAVLGIHRDFGDRTNRKHARLKYVLAERGVDWCRAEVEQRAGVRLETPRPFQFTKQGDLLGWHRQTNGNYFLGLFVENGRIKDADGYRLKSGLRKAVEQFQPEVRLTASQNILLVNVRADQREGLARVLSEHGVSVENPFTPTRLASMACPALPTCGLSLAESERVMPDLLSRIEQLLIEVGLRGQEIVVRMTGCPNGCARPYMAEIGFVGKGPGKYQVYLGGNEGSTRLNRLYKESVKFEEITSELRPLLTRFAQERTPEERFGDWCDRVLLKERPVVVN